MTINTYHQDFTAEESAICKTLMHTIAEELTESESKIWHGHPVWFIEGNPIVGYSKQKAGIRLMFWSGADFGVEELSERGKKFKDASIFYNHSDEVDVEALKNWLQKSKDIQWDYKNIVKRKGVLLPLK